MDILHKRDDCAAFVRHSKKTRLLSKVKTYTPLFFILTCTTKDKVYNLIINGYNYENIIFKKNIK